MRCWSQYRYVVDSCYHHCFRRRKSGDLVHASQTDFLSLKPLKLKLHDNGSVIQSPQTTYMQKVQAPSLQTLIFYAQLLFSASVINVWAGTLKWRGTYLNSWLVSTLLSRPVICGLVQVLLNNDTFWDLFEFSCNKDTPLVLALSFDVHFYTFHFNPHRFEQCYHRSHSSIKIVKIPVIYPFLRNKFSRTR